MLFVATFFFIRPFVVLVYTSVEHSIEDWACLLSSQGRNDNAQSLCRELRTTRYLLIPLSSLGVGFLVLVIWLTFGRLKQQDTGQLNVPCNAKLEGDKTQV